MLETIYNKIEEYNLNYGDMPNTVLLPSSIYETLKLYHENIVSILGLEDTKPKVFDLDMISVSDKEDIRVVKIVYGRIDCNNG